MAFIQNQNIDLWKNNLFFMNPGTGIDVFHEHASVSN